MNKLTKKWPQKVLLATFLSSVFYLSCLQNSLANDLGAMHLLHVRNQLWYEGVSTPAVQSGLPVAVLTAESDKSPSGTQAKAIPEELLKAVIYFQAKQL